MYRAIIAGGRDFDDLPLLITECNRILEPFTDMDIQIVSGGQRAWIQEKKRYIGADYLGEQYADLRGFDLIRFVAEWDKYRPANSNRKNPAGMIRNHQMGDYAKAGPIGGRLIAFWDGKSPGTSDMIEYADSIGLPFRVIHY